jgi:hypothetical protein
MPVVVGLVVGAAVVCAAVGVGLHVLVFHGSAADPQPYVSGAVIGAGSCIAVGIAQPWGERRRRRRDGDGRSL